MGHGIKQQTFVILSITKYVYPLNFRSNSTVSLKIDLNAEYFNAEITHIFIE